MSEYLYGMINRPAREAAPDGWQAGSAHIDFPYGTAIYDRPLSAKELYDYEMVLLDPQPPLPLYPAGTLVRDVRNGNTCEIDRFDGYYFAGSRRLDCEAVWWYLRGWMFYEVVALATPMASCVWSRRTSC